MSISVIIPTYKPQDYLWKCLDSLEAQTLDKRLWEVVLVLNGCNEPWLTEIQNYAKEHLTMRLSIIQTDTAGVSNARNIGLDNAAGEYIAFIDDDDYVSPSYLEALLQIADIDTIAASNTIGFSDEQAHIPYYLEKEYNNKAKAGKQPFYKAKKYFGGPCMKLIHRDMIDEQRFDTRFRNGEDSLFMFAISPKIRYIRFTDTNAIYYRRFRIGSASKTYTRKQALQNGWKLICQYTQLFHKEKYNRYFYRTRILGVLHSILVN